MKARRPAHSPRQASRAILQLLQRGHDPAGPSFVGAQPETVAEGGDSVQRLRRQAAQHDFAVRISLVASDLASETVVERDGLAALGPNADRVNMNSGRVSGTRLGEYFRLVVVSLAVGQDDDRSIAPLGAVLPQQRGRFTNRRRQRRASDTGHGRVQRIQVEVDRTVIHGERRHPIGGAGERDQSDAMPCELRHQPSPLQARALQPIRSDIFRPQRFRDIHGQHDAQRARLLLDFLRPPLRTRQSETKQRQRRRDQSSTARGRSRQVDSSQALQHAHAAQKVERAPAFVIPGGQKDDAQRRADDACPDPRGVFEPHSIPLALIRTGGTAGFVRSTPPGAAARRGSRTDESVR